MFERHQFLISLLVALELEVGKGKVDSREMDLLCSNFGGLAAQLDLIDLEGQETGQCRKPHWVTYEVSQSGDEHMVSMCYDYFIVISVHNINILFRKSQINHKN